MCASLTGYNAAQHPNRSMLLETGKPAVNPFAAMMGGSTEEAKDEFGRPKTYRHYALGAVLSGGTAQVRLLHARDAASAVFMLASPGCNAALLLRAWRYAAYVLPSHRIGDSHRNDMPTSQSPLPSISATVPRTRSPRERGGASPPAWTMTSGPTALRCSTPAATVVSCSLGSCWTSGWTPLGLTGA